MEPHAIIGGTPDAVARGLRETRREIELLRDSARAGGLTAVRQAA